VNYAGKVKNAVRCIGFPVMERYDKLPEPLLKKDIAYPAKIGSDARTITYAS